MLRATERHEQIKMRLRLAGSSLSQIARELHVKPATVTIVSQGQRRSRRIEAAISGKLGMSPEALWPERYGPVVEGAEEHSRPIREGGAPAMPTIP